MFRMLCCLNHLPDHLIGTVVVRQWHLWGTPVPPLAKITCLCFITVVMINNIPAQISEGLKIQLFHLLLTEPVADSPASQEGLHLHGDSHTEGNAETEASTCAAENRMSPYEGHSSGWENWSSRLTRYGAYLIWTWLQPQTEPFHFELGVSCLYNIASSKWNIALFSIRALYTEPPYANINC